jgi:oligoendopeptidase F
MSIKTKGRWNFKLLLGPEGENALTEIRSKAEKASYKFINKWSARTDWLEEPEALKEALDDYEAWARFSGPNSTEEYYYDLRHAQDQNDPAIKAGMKKAGDLAKKIGNDIHFFTLKLGKVGVDQQKEFLASPLLAPYRHFLEHLFAEAKHTLSEAEEKIITLYSGSAYADWVRMTSGFIAAEQREIKIGAKKGKSRL